MPWGKVTGGTQSFRAIPQYALFSSGICRSDDVPKRDLLGYGNCCLSLRALGSASRRKGTAYASCFSVRG